MSARAPGEPIPPCARALRIAVPAAAALLVLLVLGPRSDRPVDRGIAGSLFSYQTLFARNWDEAGFRALLGIPCVGAGGSTVAERWPYLHHPVLSYWAIYASRQALGWTERAFRIPSMLAMALAAGALVALAARRIGFSAALVTTAFIATSPLTLLYGDLPNPEPFVLAALAGGFLLRERTRETAGRGLLLAIAFAVGCQFDWQVYFLVPALFVQELLRPRGTRRFRDLFPMLGAVLPALLLTLGHFAVAMGGVDALRDHVLRTALVTLRGGTDRSFGGWLEHQRVVLDVDLGWTAAALLAAGLLIGLARPRMLQTEAGALVVASFVPLVLNHALFRVPAYDHRFYWMPALVGLPLLAGVLFQGLSLHRPVLAASALVLLLAGNLVTGYRGEALRDAARDPMHDHRVVAALVDRFADSSDLVLTPEALGPAMFYARARFYDTIDTAAKVQAILERPRAGRVVWVFFKEENLARHAELAAWLGEHGHEVWHPGIKAWRLRT
jgi:hypothetical protein